MTTKSIATVGAGFSGTLPSLHLPRHCPPGTRVVLIERLAGPQPGGGAGRPPRVRRPGAHGRVPRRRFERVRGEVVGLDRSGPRLRLQINRGREVRFDLAVLAVGNFPPAPIPGEDPSFYDSALHQPGGLEAFDVVGDRGLGAPFGDGQIADPGRSVVQQAGQQPGGRQADREALRVARSPAHDACGGADEFLTEGLQVVLHLRRILGCGHSPSRNTQRRTAATTSRASSE